MSYVDVLCISFRLKKHILNNTPVPVEDSRNLPTPGPRDAWFEALGLVTHSSSGAKHAPESAERLSEALERRRKASGRGDWVRVAGMLTPHSQMPSGALFSFFWWKGSPLQSANQKRMPVFPMATGDLSILVNPEFMTKGPPKVMIPRETHGNPLLIN